MLDDRLIFSCLFQLRAFCARLFVVFETFMRGKNRKETGQFVKSVMNQKRGKLCRKQDNTSSEATASSDSGIARRRMSACA